MEISVKEGVYGYRHHHYMIVAGLSKRSIRVIFAGVLDPRIVCSRSELAVKAARYAAGRGWKNVVLMPDSTYGDYVWTCNLDQYRTAHQRGYPAHSYHILH